MVALLLSETVSLPRRRESRRKSRRRAGKGREIPRSAARADEGPFLLQRKSRLLLYVCRPAKARVQPGQAGCRRRKMPVVEQRTHSPVDRSVRAKETARLFPAAQRATLQNGRHGLWLEISWRKFIRYLKCGFSRYCHCHQNTSRSRMNCSIMLICDLMVNVCKVC